MVSLVALLALGSAVPEVAFMGPDEKQVKLSSVKGSFAVVISGVDKAKDTEMLAALEKLAIENKPLKSFICPPETAPALGLDGGRKALLVNQGGRVIKYFDNPIGLRFVDDLTKWLLQTSLPNDYPLLDPRLILDPEFKRPEGEKGLLVLFLAAGGVVDEMYGKRLKAIADECAAAKIAVVGIFSAHDEGGAEIGIWAKSQEYAFPCVLDPGAAVADLFHATRNPECFLFGGDGKLAYTGSVDSSSWEAATNRRYLGEAVAAVAAGKVAKLRRTAPFGTIIRRQPSDDRKSGGSPPPNRL